MMQKPKSGRWPTQGRRNNRKSPLNALSMPMWYRADGATWTFNAKWGSAEVVREGAGWAWNGKLYHRSHQARKAAQRDVARAAS